MEENILSLDYFCRFLPETPTFNQDIQGTYRVSGMQPVHFLEKFNFSFSCFFLFLCYGQSLGMPDTQGGSFPLSSEVYTLLPLCLPASTAEPACFLHLTFLFLFLISLFLAATRSYSSGSLPVGQTTLSQGVSKAIR